MKTVTLNSFDEVLSVANVYGGKALDHAILNNKFSQETVKLVMDCKQWAKSTTFNIKDFNDGNSEHSIDINFKRDHSCFMGYTTFHHDITVISSGIDSFLISFYDAMEQGKITKEQAVKILREINARNEALNVLES